MDSRPYARNLSYAITEEELYDSFVRAEAQQAINRFNGQELGE